MTSVNRVPKVVRANRRAPDSRDTRMAHHGWFYHARQDAMVPYKGVLSCDFLIVTAASPEVIEFSTAPEPLQWWNGSRWEEYRPRYAVLCEGFPKGVIDTVDVEVVHGFEYGRDRAMYERLTRDAKSKARVFKVYTEREIKAEPRYTNAIRICCHADARTIPEDDLEAVAAFAEGRDVFTLDEAMAATRLDFARAYPAVLNRVAAGMFEIDLDRAFGNGSPVRRRRRG